MSDTTAQELLTALKEALSATETVIGAVTKQQFKDASPNPGWDNHDALDHLVKVVVIMARALGAQDLKNAPKHSTAADFNEAATALVSAAEQPGALDATVSLPWGEAPAVDVLRTALTEVMVHGWDLAQGTDQQVTWDDQTAQLALDIANARPEGGPYAAPVQLPDGAPLADRLVARTGRDPRR